MRKYHYINNLFAEYFISPKTLYFERDTFNLTECIKKIFSVSKKNYFYCNHETKSHGITTDQKCTSLPRLSL